MGMHVRQQEVTRMRLYIVGADLGFRIDLLESQGKLMRKLLAFFGVGSPAQELIGETEGPGT